MLERADGFCSSVSFRSSAPFGYSCLPVRRANRVRMCTDPIQRKVRRRSANHHNQDLCLYVQRRTLLILAGILCAALFSFAFIAAPYSCEWGATAYFFAGVASIAVLFVGAIVVKGDSPLVNRIVLSLGLDLAVLFVWSTGLFVANVRILCRLF